MMETVESRAVRIAAKMMATIYLCRYDDPIKCRRTYVDEKVCGKCIEKWLLSKARKELRTEGRNERI